MQAVKPALMGRPKKSEPTENYRMPQRLARKLRQLAVDADMDASDYFEREFGALVEARHLKMSERAVKEARKKQDEPE